MADLRSQIICLEELPHDGTAERIRNWRNAMAKKHYVMLAKDYDSERHAVRGWFMSEKLDGVRAWWDGGISRGLLASEVPYANIEKHGRFLVPPRATGLWTRYGQPIQAPDWWLDKLPQHPLDGELYLGRKQFQRTISCVRGSGEDWVWLKYYAFDVPSYSELFGVRAIKEANANKVFGSDVLSWAALRGASWLTGPRMFFELNEPQVHKDFENEVVYWHRQVRLSSASEAIARIEIQTRLSEVVAGGGEGLMLRPGSMVWRAERVSTLLKVKPDLKGTGVVRGYRTGLGKYLGMVGSLVVEMPNGKRFNLSGLTDSERGLGLDAKKSAMMTPDCIYLMSTLRFELGQEITYKYRELTDDGLPKEARYART